VPFTSDQPENYAALSSDDRGAVERLWLLMLTRKLWLISAAMGAVMFIGSVIFDLVLLQHGATPLAIVVSNTLVALLAATLVFTLLAYGREQRRRIMERLEALNEVNHHVRNALQSLAFTSAALKGSKESAAISEAIQRIQFALLEILPKVEPTYEPFQGSAREASERKQLAKDRRPG
jgi:ABC-type multidrug transport system fused ATPase/permease subunit